MKIHPKVKSWRAYMRTIRLYQVWYGMNGRLYCRWIPWKHKPKLK